MPRYPLTREAVTPSPFPGVFGTPVRRNAINTQPVNIYLRFGPTRYNMHSRAGSQAGTERGFRRTMFAAYVVGKESRIAASAFTTLSGLPGRAEGFARAGAATSERACDSSNAKVGKHHDGTHG